MITVTTPGVSRHGKRKQKAHPDWEQWMEACAYTPEQARKELGLANGTFYRQVKCPPDAVMRLAMAACWEGLEGFPKCMTRGA